MKLDNSLGKTVLITGGAGFIGSNFIKYFLAKNSKTKVVNLDKLTYAGNLENLGEIGNNDRYSFVEGDICDYHLVKTIFKEKSIKGLIHFAAESHVDNSIKDPNSFIKTNIEGTSVLLEVAKEFWLEEPNVPKGGFENSRFHHISTDEVYGSLGAEGVFTEESKYAPNSPYSASKAASDFLVRSYNHTYGLNIVTTNCSNNYGPNQHDEKLIPTVIRKALNDEPIPIYGDGKNVRDWLYVIDHCEALNTVFNKGRTGETYVIGGNCEYNNLYIAIKICDILDELEPKKNGKYQDQITFVENRLGHDYRYAIDFSKISEELNWEPKENFESGIRKTIKWYAQKYLGK
ncbi:dTDP-glucose 4,6-dehydratase [Maribacter sp. HTCC2170]|uniref:dTDP-glucose 4,6-dehydratase n=1 Tax=Maribacter sp. (strain HTCC2170 / KCCM 42371) TaxID=313603 RepID=UPI00006BD39D|nr:dTDP-glucose 4,6-dehydratase [Maribacter sp. HTCC2170]EAR02780.1 spore coat polysaccharide synthesis [Maribacter sp. HTCC2170]